MSDLDITRIPENLDPWYSEIETIWDEIEASINDNTDRLEFLENKPPRHIKVTYIDPTSTSLPAGPAVTIDDNSGVNGDLVLFTNLSTGNNRVYLLSGIGSNAVWTPQELFGVSSALSEDPDAGDMVTASAGAFFQNQTAIYDGSEWKVNDIIRLFNGSSFWELTSLKTTTVTNNTVGEIFSVAAEGSEHISMSFSIVRGSSHETGQLYLSHDGVNVSIAVAGTAPGASGVDFQASIVGSDLVLEYDADNSASNGTLKYFLHRWSDTVGGPAGIPNYAGTGGNLLSAAGNDQEIQYNDGGEFAADSRFKWNSATGAISLGAMEIHPLSSELPLLDNQTSTVTIFSYDASDYKHAFLNYSLERDGETEAGNMQVTNNGITASLTRDYASTDSLGIGLFAVMNGSNVDIKYTSTSTGFTSIFRYSMTRWTNS